MRSNFVILVSILCVAAPSFAEDDWLAQVRQLYEGASYAEALDALARSDGRIPADIADEYRASCLLAVGRAGEAERVLEALIARRPELTFDGSDRSPKLLTLFRSVQKRAVPAALKVRYASAKAEFEAGRLEAASAQFKNLISTLDRVATILDADTAADLRTLAEGFVRLSALPVLVQPAATPAAAIAPAVMTEGTPSPVYPPRDVYDERDADVVPPVAIDQRMPAWNAPRAFQRGTFRGLLEIVIDENGAVTAGAMRQPAHPLYDDVLLSATRRWAYYPAVREGRPVTYRKLIVVTLHGDR